MNLFRMFADIVTPEMLNIPVPEILTGQPIIMDAEPSPELEAYVKGLVRRSERIEQKIVRDPSVDNMLMVTNDGRNAALDMRVVNPNMPDFPGSKVNICVRNVFSIYEETKAGKSTQMIFSDLSTPDEGRHFVIPMKETSPDHFEMDRDAIQKRGFTNVYDDIRAKLILLGVKPSEIAYIHEANTPARKEKLFAAVRNGDVRIILGSTSKMGTGTNAQKRLIALHNLDCPWRPSDLEQHIGRGLRFGNDNPVIRIYNYVTKRCFDAYSWAIIERKARNFAQVMNGKNPSREIEDADGMALTAKQAMAIASDNPLIIRQMELDIKLRELRVLPRHYLSQSLRAGEHQRRHTFAVVFHSWLG